MGTYTTKELERIINNAAERGAGIFYEKIKHDIGLVLEATDSIKKSLERKIDRDEFKELESKVKVDRRVLTDTNKDLKGHGRRITRLENTVYNA